MSVKDMATNVATKTSRLRAALKKRLFYEISEYKALFSDEVEAQLAVLSKDSPEYENAVGAAALCNKALQTEKEKRDISEKLKETGEKLAAIKSFASLNEEDAKMFANMAESFMALKKELSELVFKPEGFNGSLSYQRGDGAESVIAHMREAEKFQRAILGDIASIEGEKEELERARARLSSISAFIKRFSAVGALLFTAFACFIAYAFVDAPALEASALPALMAFAAAVIFYVFNERLKRDLRKNIKKQNRAVALLNKKNALYAHYTNYLEYEYEKYNVRGSKILEANINEYKTYAITTARITALRKTTREAEKRLRAFIKEKNVDSQDIEQLAKSAVARMANIQKLEDEKTALKSRLDVLEGRRLETWRLINAAKANDSSKNRVVERIIQSCFA